MAKPSDASSDAAPDAEAKPSYIIWKDENARLRFGRKVTADEKAPGQEVSAGGIVECVFISLSLLFVCYYT